MPKMLPCAILQPKTRGMVLSWIITLYWIVLVGKTNAVSLQNFFTLNSQVTQEIEGSSTNSGLLADHTTRSKLECSIRCFTTPGCWGFIVSGTTPTINCQIFDRILRKLHTPQPTSSALYYRKDIASCPSSFYDYNGMCFKEYSTPMTWIQAMTSCQQEGGFLFNVSTADRQTFVQGAFDINYDYHLGGFLENGNWIWPDGSLMSGGYTNWGSSPTTGGCLKVQTGGAFLWSDIDCNVDLLRSVCEITVTNN
ncbi:asialoglycoprotein receptor 2-like [Argopecten irradians]|uniref:asialoglycoprotein receptor 2-like n=1 Tax=Argopecten irradians TaxID=31199 RepID=UPI00371F537A